MKASRLMAACLVALIAIPVLAQDDSQKGLDEAVKMAAAVNDPIFNQYVNLAELDDAWTYLNAEALADIGIKLANGERILARKHPAVSSEDVLKIAVRTASVSGDTKTLEKLEEFAKEADNAEMVGQIRMAKQLAGTSRSVAPTVSLDDLSITTLIDYKQAQLDLKAALIIGDADMLKGLQERVNENAEKDPGIWSKLNTEVNEQVKNMAVLGAASRGGPNDMSGPSSVLNKLSSASRGGLSFGIGPGGASISVGGGAGRVPTGGGFARPSGGTYIPPGGGGTYIPPGGGFARTGGGTYIPPGGGGTYIPPGGGGTYIPPGGGGTYIPPGRGGTYIPPGGGLPRTGFGSPHGTAVRRGVMTTLTGPRGGSFSIGFGRP